jgi:hypothetical protein
MLNLRISPATTHKSSISLSFSHSLHTKISFQAVPPLSQYTSPSPTRSLSSHHPRLPVPDTPSCDSTTTDDPRPLQPITSIITTFHRLPSYTRRSTPSHRHSLLLHTSYQQSNVRSILPAIRVHDTNGHRETTPSLQETIDQDPSMRASNWPNPWTIK